METASSITQRTDPIKACFSILLAIYAFNCARDVENSGLLDRVDLIAHEAGHLFFSYFGELLHVMGGTIGQLLVPAGIIVYFTSRRELFSAAVVLFWLGQSMFNVSVYIRDARAMELPLASIGGGEDTIHDWNYLLGRFGLLNWDGGLATFVYTLGVLTLIASVGLCFYLSVRRAGD